MAEHSPKRPPNDTQGFKIGNICALSLEAEMVELALDKVWDGSRYKKAPNDSNAYTTGMISGHNVVLAYCPGRGRYSAAYTAVSLLRSFTKIELAFVVGICGAVPSYMFRERLQEILLGDCLISTAFTQFDMDRQGLEGSVRKHESDELRRSSLQIRALMAKLRTSMNKRKLVDALSTHLQVLQKAEPESTYYPGKDKDKLHNANYTHTHRDSETACEKCDKKIGVCERSCGDLGCSSSELVHRKRLDDDHGTSPSIHFGYFGFSDIVLKNGLEWDKLAKAINAIAFDMEGVGVWDFCSTVFIKGAFDYADSHRNKIWHEYAAAVAAAGLKALLAELEQPVEELPGNRGPYIAMPFPENQHFVERNTKLSEEVAGGDILGSHEMEPEVTKTVVGKHLENEGSMEDARPITRETRTGRGRD